MMDSRRPRAGGSGGAEDVIAGSLAEGRVEGHRRALEVDEIPLVADREVIDGLEVELGGLAVGEHGEVLLAAALAGDPLVTLEQAIES